MQVQIPADHRLQLIWMASNRKGEQIALLLQSNWQELGFQSDIESRVWAHFVSEIARPESAPMVAPVYISPPIPDPDSVPSIRRITHRGTANGRRRGTSRMPR